MPAPEISPRVAFTTPELLESRIAPATIVNPTTVTYQDMDGDRVTVKFSKPVFTDAVSPNEILRFSTGLVTDQNDSTPQQLEQIVLTALGSAEYEGLGIKVTVKRAKGGTSDGLAHVGMIQAEGFDLGRISIAGDLAGLFAGDDDTADGYSVRSLKVHSLGHFGTDTQGDPQRAGYVVDNLVRINGPLGTLTVQRDVAHIEIFVTGDVQNLTTPERGTIEKVKIGGSLIGGSTSLSGVIQATGQIGQISIKGSIIGGTGDETGAIMARDNVGSLQVGGSLVGGIGMKSGMVRILGEAGTIQIGRSLLGTDALDTGSIFVTGDAGSVSIGGDVRGGSAFNSGVIHVLGDTGSINIRGSLLGGSGEAQSVEDEQLAHIYVGGVLKRALVGGDVVGNTGDGSGNLTAAYGIGSVRIGGDVVSDLGAFSGRVGSNGTIDKVEVRGSVIGGATVDGTTFQQGGISARALGSVHIRGDLVALGEHISDSSVPHANTGVSARLSLGSLRIDGDVIGRADGRILIGVIDSTDAASPSLGLGSVRIGGDARFVDIVSGVRLNLGNSDFRAATIGSVRVGGDWTASSIVAGVISTDRFYGNEDDRTGLTSAEPVVPGVSRIAQIVIGGQVHGTPASENPEDHFGFVAEQIGNVKIAGRKLSIPAGQPVNILLSATGDVRLRTDTRDVVLEVP